MPTTDAHIHIHPRRCVGSEDAVQSKDIIVPSEKFKLSRRPSVKDILLIRFMSRPARKNYNENLSHVSLTQLELLARAVLQNSES